MAAFLEIENPPYISNSLTSHREIWLNDAHWHLLPDQPLIFGMFENSRCHIN